MSERNAPIQISYLTKMQPFGYYLGISKQTEVLFLTLIGICCTVFDASLLDLNTNLHKVWEIALDSTKVSENTQTYLKYILSGIVLVRTFSVHLYLAFYIVMLWPALFEERPALLLPWLMIVVIKCLAMGFVSFFVGLFTCMSYGVYRPACADFVLAQIIDHIPSFYMLFCVLSYYRELKMSNAVIAYESSKISFDSQITIRRRKVRSMADRVIVHPIHHHQIDEDRHLISVSTIENIVQQLKTDLHRKTTRSLDSLLGVMAAEAEKDEIMNLGDDLPSEDIGLTIQEKTAKILKITEADILKARQKPKVPIFTESMVNINVNPAEKTANVFRSADITLTLPSHVDNNLRTTRSETGDTKNPECSLSNTVTDFMSDISETVIGSILNYSSTFITTSNNEQMVRSIIEEDILSHLDKEPVKLKDSHPAIRNEVEVKQRLKPDTTLKKPHVISKVNQMRSKKSDFGCQASTLSSSVLESYMADLERYPVYWKSAYASKKVSPRTTLTKPSLKEGGIENYRNIVGKNLKEIQEIMPVKAEGPRYASSFKLDGYTIAYNERMLKIRNQKLTKRNIKDVKERNSTIK